MATKNKKPFSKRYKNYKKKGNIKKLNKWEKLVEREINKEISDLTSKIENDEEKLEEAYENMEDHFMEVDLNKIEDPDLRQEYAREYVSDLIYYPERNIEPIRERISDNNERIKILKDSLEFFHTVEPEVEEGEEENID